MIQVMETKLRINLIFFELEFNITRILNELRVLLKFNLLFLPVIAACYAATGYVVWNQLSANAEQEVMETARLMLETARAMRTYTTTQVAPLLDQEQAKVARSIQNMEQALDVQMSAVLNKAMPPRHPTAQEQKVWQTARQQLANSVHPRNNDASQPQFFPQSIPFYAATEAFNYFREKFPDFSYKEAALNPTNPRDRTADWEADVVNYFRDNPAKAEFVGRRDTPSGSSLYLSTPVRVDSESCLSCHGPTNKAPPEIVKLYGTGNGFGWQLNDVAGAQIVSVPADVAHNRAASAMKTVSIWLAGVFAGFYLIVNAIVFVFISRLVPPQEAQ
jgi:hypothetical protein